MNQFRKVYFFFGKIRDIGIISILTLIIGIVVMQIFLRYVATGNLRPFAWGDELVRNLSAWVFFLGASLASREGAHITLDLAVKKLKGKLRFIVEKTVGLATLAVIALVIVVGFQAALDNPASMVNLPNVPMTAFFLAIPVGMIFVFVDFLLILVFGHHPFSRKALAAKAQLEAADNKSEGETK